MSEYLKGMRDHVTIFLDGEPIQCLSGEPLNLHTPVGLSEYIEPYDITIHCLGVMRENHFAPNTVTVPMDWVKRIRTPRKIKKALKKRGQTNDFVHYEITIKP